MYYSNDSDRGLFYWSFFTILLLFFFSLGHYSVVAALPVAFFIAGVIFFVPLFYFKNSPEVVFPFAILFSLLITAFYAPVFGVFMGFDETVSGFITKVTLGVRSSYFSFWVFAAAVVFGWKYDKGFTRNVLLGVASVILMGFFISRAPLDTKLTYLLNSFLPLISGLMFVFSIFRTKRLLPYGSFLSSAAVVIAFVAIAYFPLALVFHEVFRPDLALSHQTTDLESRIGGRPGQWGTLIYDMRIPRFVGTFPNPILFGYFAAVCAFVFFVNRRKIIGTLFVVITIMSLSKGAWTFLFGAAVLFFFLTKSKKLFYLAIFSLVALQLSLASVIDGSNKVHYRGLIGGVTSVAQADIGNQLFGFGLGSGGNLARKDLDGGSFSAGWLASGSESGIGVIVYQFGFVGIGLFLYFLFNGLNSIILSSWASGQRLESDRSRAVASLLAAWFINLFLQEDLLNATVITIILLGVVVLFSDKTNPGLR